MCLWVAQEEIYWCAYWHWTVARLGKQVSFLSYPYALPLARIMHHTPAGPLNDLMRTGIRLIYLFRYVLEESQSTVIFTRNPSLKWQSVINWRPVCIEVQTGTGIKKAKSLGEYLYLGLPHGLLVNHYGKTKLDTRSSLVWCSMDPSDADLNRRLYVLVPFPVSMSPAPLFSSVSITSPENGVILTIA